MKKRLSLLMVLMMVLSLVPMSVFATAGSMPGGLIKVDDTDKDTVKKVTVKLTQAAGTTLTTGGKAKLTLSKGEFARLAGTDSLDNVTAGQAGVPADVTTRKAEFDFSSDLQNYYPNTASTTNLTLDTAFANVAYINIPNIPEFQGVISKEFDILVTFYAYFDEEDAGDITLAVEEQNDSGLDVAKAIVVGTVNVADGDDMKVVVDDATKKIGFDGGELSKFTVKDMDKNPTVTYLTLELPDYVRWNVDAGKTIASLGGTTVPVVIPDSKDPHIAKVVIPTADMKKDLQIRPIVTVTRRDASKGDVTLKVIAKESKVVNGVTVDTKLETVDKVIGTIADYDVTMSAVEKGKKEMPAIYGGDDATIRVKLSGVEGSFTDGREMDFTVKGADVEYDSIKEITAVKKVTSSIKDDGGIVEDGEFTLTVDGTAKKTLEFDLKIKADYAQNGAVTISADSRDFGTIEAEIAKVTPAYTVDTKVTSIKKGESLATADIVIKEAKAGLLDTDKFIILNLNDKNRGTMTFGSDYKVEVTNGMKIEDGLYAEDGSTRKDLESMAIQIKTASSKEAGTITISNVLVKVDGASVDGEKMLETYIVEKDDQKTNTVKVKDKATAVEYALDKDADLDPDYSVKYVNVVKEYGSVATTTVFKIGSKEYTVNGEAKTANEAPFVSGKGYTMLPVKAVAEALGLKADWNASTKTASFSNDSKVATVVIGADTMYVNGTPFKLSAKAEIKNGSTFVELRSLASAFGVKLEWDAATKSVTIQG